MTNESEFGKGLVICLVKFAEHKYRWADTKNTWRELRKEHPDLFSVSDAVEIHFNGASDHLYEIEVPVKWMGSDIDKKVQELKSFGLRMGHGFSQDEKWTEEDVDKAYNLCQDIAILIDKMLELKPDIGVW